MTRLRWPIAVLLWLLPALALSQSTTPGGSGSGGGAASVDAAISTYSITATGPMPGVPLKDYAAVLAHVLSGTFTAQVEVSVNSTDGTNGDWDAVLQGYHPEVPAGAIAAAVSGTTRRRIYNTAGGVWARINVTAFTAAGSIALVRRTEAYAERSVFVAGGSINATTRSAGINRSATVGTAAVALWPSDAARQGGWIKNDTATALWCNFDGTATAAAGGGNFQVAANGGAYTTEPGFVSTNALSCISTASIAVTSRTH